MDTPRDAHSGGLNQALAAVIQGERAKAGLTIDQTADASGINRQTLLRRLTGKGRSDINVNEVEQLARVFKLTPAEMIQQAEEWQARNAAHSPDTDAALDAYRRGYAAGDTPDPQPGKKAGESA